MARGNECGSDTGGEQSEREPSPARLPSDNDVHDEGEDEEKADGEADFGDEDEEKSEGGRPSDAGECHTGNAAAKKKLETTDSDDDGDSQADSACERGAPAVARTLRAGGSHPEAPARKVGRAGDAGKTAAGTDDIPPSNTKGCDSSGARALKAGASHPEAPRKKLPRSAQLKAQAAGGSRATSAPTSRKAEPFPARLAELEAQIAAMALNKDFAGAAALQETLQREGEDSRAREAPALCSRQEVLEAQLAELLRMKDYAGAAALQGRIDEEGDNCGALAVSGTEPELEEQIEVKLQVKDYAGAAALKKNMDELERQPRCKRDANAEAFAIRQKTSARADAVARRQKELQEQIAAMVDKKDFASAAELQDKLNTVERDIATSPSRQETLDTELAMRLLNKDYAGAAVVQAKLSMSDSHARAPFGMEADCDARDIRKKELEEQLEKKVLAKDFASAAAIQEQLEDTQRANTSKKSARADAVARRQKELEEQIAAMVDKKDFASAAELQDKLNTVERDIATSPSRQETLDTELAMRLLNKDYAGAAVVQAKLSMSDSHARAPFGMEADCDARDIRKKELEEQLEKKVLAKDFASAAAIQEQLEDTQRANTSKKSARADAVARRQKELEEQIAAMVDKKDFARAAELQHKRNTVGADIAVSPSRQESLRAQAVHRKGLEQQIREKVRIKDYAGAALLQDTIEEMGMDAALQGKNDAEAKKHARAPAAPTGKDGGAATPLSKLLDATAVLPSRLRLDRVRLLCIGKKDSLPASKGKTKGNCAKGKPKGNEELQAVYFGDEDGFVVCTLASGECLRCVPRLQEGRPAIPLVNVTALKPRAGQLGLLEWTKDTEVAFCAEPHLTEFTFPYGLVSFSKDFATWAVVQGARVGDYVALVLRILCVEEKYTATKGEPFLQVTGLDLDSAPTDNLRFWRYECGDLVEGNIYIVRGLKVALKQQWSDELKRYAPNTQGINTVESTYRTAAEDVTHVEAISSYFA